MYTKQFGQTDKKSGCILMRIYVQSRLNRNYIRTYVAECVKEPISHIRAGMYFKEKVVF